MEFIGADFSILQRVTVERIGKKLCCIHCLSGTLAAFISNTPNCIHLAHFAYCLAHFDARWHRLMLYTGISQLRRLPKRLLARLIVI
jgi:hypothetical protein